MHRLLRLLLIHLLTCVGQNALGSEIIHGKKAPDNLMLYMASVQIDRSHICGGFLISEDFVLTAAHCADKREPTSVVLGTHNLKKVNNDTRYDVECIFKHPCYNSARCGNDIMLLKLSKKVRLDNRVQPIQLPRTISKIKDKAKCRVAGWGFTKTGGQKVDVLQVVEVPFVKLEVCETQWKKLQLDLPDNVICAGGYGTKNGFCQGDSGGPLVCGGTAVGVVSFNMDKNCDYPNVPNVYTDISKYLPWIRDILKKKKSRGGKIINGDIAPENWMLYMASLQNNRSHVCGGFLVSEDFVMTAAHCANYNPTIVVLGTHDLKSVDDNMIYGLEQCKHPSYVKVSRGNDIMLLKLSRKAQLGGRVETIGLPSHEINLNDSMKCHVAGWGYTVSYGTVVDDLREVDVPTINLGECQKEWNDIIPANVICAGGYGTDKGFCQGDSGGPLVCNGTAVGVVSFNNMGNCSYPNAPNVYTDISKYLAWIEKVLREKTC